MHESDKQNNHAETTVGWISMKFGEHVIFPFIYGPISAKLNHVSLASAVLHI